MSVFAGFQHEHFDYFLSHDDDDSRRWVFDQMNAFAARVRTALRDVDSFYQIRHVGRLLRSDAYCWTAFGPRPFIPKCRGHAHQSIALSHNGLRMFVNIETKPATNRLKAAVSRPELLDALEAPPQI